MSTYNRLDYLRKFVETWSVTRSLEFAWTLVVADDGSTDGTLEWLSQLAIPDARIVAVRNKRATIAGQANAILRAAEAVGFDFGFKADDDVWFTAPGWDHRYLRAAQEDGRDHLVFHDPAWKPGTDHRTSEQHESFVPARDAMGCLYTFTPGVLSRIGYMDELAFPVRGHSHLDFTIRACRAGFNDEDHLWDAKDARQEITMWPREGYVDLTDWNDPAVVQALNDQERARRWKLIQDPDRIFVSDLRGDPAEPRRTATVTPEDFAVADRLLATGRFRLPNHALGPLDAVFVLNLERDIGKWRSVAARLARAGITAERFPAVDGASEHNLRAWRAYSAEGLTHPHELLINRKLIQSPGAWGYLLSMKSLIEHAQERRLNRILVLDDDVLLHRRAQERLARLWSELPDDWKMVYLGHTPEHRELATSFSDGILRPGAGANGSFAVAYDASIFEVLLAEIDKFTWPFDAGPLRRVAREHEDDVYAADPPIVIADVSTSGIRAPRDMERFARDAGWHLADYDWRGAQPHMLSGETGSSALTDPQVSVLVVTHENEATIGDSLRSLRRQTLGHTEILVAVLPGRDRTPEVVSRLAGQDPRLRIVEVEGTDKRVALNVLLELARGEMVSVLGPDAVLQPDALERLSRPSEQRPVWVPAEFVCTTQAPPGEVSPDTLARFADRFQNGSATGGLLSRGPALAAGGFLLPGQAGLVELAERVQFQEQRHRDNLRTPPIAGGPVGVLGPLSSATAGRLPKEICELHEEIRKGLRPAAVAKIPFRVRATAAGPS